MVPRANTVREQERRHACVVSARVMFLRTGQEGTIAHSPPRGEPFKDSSRLERAELNQEKSSEIFVQEEGHIAHLLQQ